MVCSYSYGKSHKLGIKGCFFSSGISGRLGTKILIPNIASLLHIILEEVNSYKVPLKSRSKFRDIGEPPVSKYPMVFFNGVAANFIGGAGICIWLNDHHILAIKLGCGNNTNTRAKLLAL